MYMQGIMFIVRLYVYKALNNLAPAYIFEQLAVYKPPRPLRSSMAINRLVEPKSNLLIGDRSFYVVVAIAWDSLPLPLRSSNSVDIFIAKSPDLFILRTHSCFFCFLCKSYA